jgi:hypothetical protein
MNTYEESILEYAANAGEDRPESAWILSPFDVWVRNPHYVGSPQPHPESEDYGIIIIGTEQVRPVSVIWDNRDLF